MNWILQGSYRQAQLIIMLVMTKGIAAYRWTGTDWIYNMLDADEEIQPNLSKYANMLDDSYKQ